MTEVGVSRAVAALWERFRAVNESRVGELETVAIAMLSGDPTDETRLHACRTAHKLAGSLGTYGFREGTEWARRIEQLLEGSTSFGEADRLRMSEWVVALRKSLEAAPSSTHAAPSPLPSLQLLLISGDDDLSERLEIEAAGRSISLLRERSAHGAMPILTSGWPHGMILDLATEAQAADALRLLERDGYSCPSVIIGARDTFAERIAAVRRGAVAFFPRSTGPSDVIASLEHAAGNRAGVGARILVVDDDPAILGWIESTLSERGMVVHTESSPARFWTALRRVMPDLIVLDVDMPGLNGVELCRILRSDREWRTLPVVFLTSRDDAATIQSVFAAGADDHVAKPGTDLVMRIENRLQRSRGGSRDNGDPAHHDRKSQLSADLERLLDLAKRAGREVVVARLRATRSDTPETATGRTAGDELLRRLGIALQQHVQPGDVLGFSADGELVAGWFDAKSGLVQQWLNEAIAAVEEDDGDGMSPISAGCAVFPRDGETLSSLLMSAHPAFAGADGPKSTNAGNDDSPPVDVLDVVIVEDDPVVADLIVHSLRVQGYRSRHIMDGEEAIAVLAGQTPTLHARVILLDVDLPGRDGLTVLRELRRSGVVDTSRVVMLTARSTEREILMALELGACDHVAKPFSVPVLLQRIRSLLQNV